MTDPDLVRRAEQAYLGALLARKGRVGTGAVVAGDAGPDALASLRPRDFTDPVHQAIYAAVARQALLRPSFLAGLRERLRGLLPRLPSARTRYARAYMAGLPGRCPDPANLPAYAAMIAEASGQRAAPAPAPAAGRGTRRAAAENARLADAGEWLEGAGPPRRPSGSQRPAPAAGTTMPRAGRTAGDLAPDVRRLARALRAEARLATQATQATQATLGPARTPLPPEPRRGPLDVEALQEQVLADLMHRPADGRDVTSWLPDTVFTAGPNCRLYQLISNRLADGRPVDPLIIAWDASLVRDPRGTAGTPGTPGTPEIAEISGTPETLAGESLAAAALRLGALDPGPGTGAVLGRALYAEHVCTDSFGPGWPEELGRTPAPTPAPAVPPVPSRRAEPAAPAARRTVASGTGWPSPSAAPAAEAASRAKTTQSAARHPMPALPRVSSPPLLHPPAPGPTGPAPVPRI